MLKMWLKITLRDPYGAELEWKTIKEAELLAYYVSLHKKFVLIFGKSTKIRFPGTSGLCRMYLALLC